MLEVEHRTEVFAIIGAAIEVHKTLGSGFLEAVYQQALEYELAQRQVPFVAQQTLPIHYKTLTLPKGYIADIVAFQKVIIEIKAAEHLATRDMAQILNYMKASGLTVGLLINFGSTGRLEWKRLVHSAH